MSPDNHDIEEKSIVCDECKKTFNSKNEYKEHIEIFHIAKQPETYSKINILNYSIEIYECELFVKVEELALHKKDMHQRLYSCDSCDFKCVIKDNLKNYVESLHKTNFSICEENFEKEMLLENYI